jgi:hypothetical protein
MIITSYLRQCSKQAIYLYSKTKQEVESTIEERRKKGKIWNNLLIKLEERYRQREIGESIFCSLKNRLGGDRVKTSLIAKHYNNDRSKNNCLFSWNYTRINYLS